MPNTHIWPCRNTYHNPVRKAQHSHLTMRGTNPALMLERFRTYIQHMQGTNPTHVFEKALHLHLTHVRNQSNIHVQKGSTLIFDTCEEPIQHTCSKRLYTYIWHMQGTNLTCMFERDCTHIWSCRNQFYSHIQMDLSPRPSIPGNWLGTSIPRMEFSAYIWSCRNKSYSPIRMA